MTLRFLAAGLAVALLASPAVLARGETGQFIVAAADTDVTQYLSETRPLSSLSDKELKQRIRAGRQLAKGGSLSSDEMKKVRAAMRTAIQELKSRGSADKTDMSDTENGGATADQSGAGSAGAAAESDQGQKKKKKAEQQATGESANAAGTDQSQNKQQMAGEPTKAAATGDAAELIADSRPLGSLDDVDPELLKTYEKLGIPLLEQKMLSGVAVDAIFD